MLVRDLINYVTGEVVLYVGGDEPGAFVDLNKACRLDELPVDMLDLQVIHIYPKNRQCLDIRVFDVPGEPELPFSGGEEVDSDV